MDKLLNNFKEWSGVVSGRRKQEPELTRSQYSLVSSSDLTPGALELWVELPEEIKYDPSLAAFRKLYEKEHGNSDETHLKQAIKNGSGPKPNRLPFVKSAPHLHHHLNTVNTEPSARNDTKNQTGCIILPSIKHSDRLLKTVEEHPKKETKWNYAGQCVKMSFLLGCWLFFTVIFLLYNEKEHIIRHSSVAPGEIKNYMFDPLEEALNVYVKLEGPYLSEQHQDSLNNTQSEQTNRMDVWLERWTLRSPINESIELDDVIESQKSQIWHVFLRGESEIDFSEGEPRSTVLRMNLPNTTRSYKNVVYNIRMRTTSNKTTPFTLTYTNNPLEKTIGVIYSCILLCGLYSLIIFEVMNRTLAAIVISTTALAVLALVGERPSMPELISWLDMETLLLLFSMMLLVAIMAETGLFDFLAVYTFEVTKGKMWPLINLLSAITALLSTFLDNVTTVLLMTPVTIRLCEVMELNPVPILMSMVLYSNIGGTATPVGDPPNVIIASNQAVVHAGINFTNFTLHMTLGILLVGLQTYFQLRYMYSDTNKLRLSVPRDIQDLRQQISIWKRAAASLAHFSKDEQTVRQALEKKVTKLSAQLETKVKERTKRACPKDTFQTTLEELKSKYKIRDKNLLIKSTIAITFVVAVFFLHSIPELKRVSLGWTALLGAIMLLILADREDMEHILKRVEWSTLLFFAALFILMEALSKLGLIQWIGGLTEGLILQVNESARLAVAILLMLWVSGITSAFVDNIPLTTMMVRVVTSLGTNPTLGLPMAPLIWALSFGACLGGNGTLIGASANVVCAGVAEQHGYKFTFMEFFKVGFPVMIGHLIVASFYLLLCHCVFTWH